MYIHFYLLLNHDDTLEATDLTADTVLRGADLTALETLDATVVLGAVRGAEDFAVELVLADEELETFELVLELELELDLELLDLELDPELELELDPVKGFTAGAEIS